MKKIYKYPVNIGEVTTLSLPTGSTVVHFAAQCDNLYVWILMNKIDVIQKVNVEFYVAGTGWDVGDNFQHIKSCQQGSYVWHLFKCL